MAGNNGLSSSANGQAVAILNWLAGGTAPTLAFPLKVVFLSVSRGNNNNTTTPDTEWPSSAGAYQASGGGATGGVVGAFFGATPASTAGTAGATIVNTLAVSTTAPTGIANNLWAGNRIQDQTAGTNKEIWYAALATAKTVNAGDTCTIPVGQLTLNLG
jgi:hypothetical protein